MNCDYTESVTAHTGFHKIQLPLLTTFSMVFQIAVFKKGVSTLDLAKVFNVDEKTAYRFRSRVQDAMGVWLSKKGDKRKNSKCTKVDGIIVANRGEELNGLQRLDLTLEEYSRKSSTAKLLRFRSAIPFDDAVDQCHLVAGRYVGERKDIRAWNYKTWLIGTHHHCSDKNLVKYENEFLFRFNNRNCQEMIWHILISELMLLKPN